MHTTNTSSTNGHQYKYDAFLCYASEDKDIFVRDLAHALKDKIEVWYDEFIVEVGDSLFKLIDRGLKESRYGIVIISPNLLKYWTGNELDGLFAKEAVGEKVILPVWLNVKQEDVVKISPILANRKAAKASDGIEEVLNNLLSVIKPEVINNKEILRKTSIPFGGSYCKLPCFFPSVSSVKTRFKPLHYIKLLVKLGHPLFLVSALDISRSKPGDQKQIRNLLNFANKDSRALIVDSGNYESYWEKNEHWKIKDYQDFLKEKYPFHYAFSYDQRDQNVKSPDHIIVNEIENRVKRDQTFSEASIIPIVHAPLSSLVSVVNEVVLRLNPIMVAVPERELGSGIIERVKTLKAIRERLNNTGQYYPIHLLGTGNPLSILIYSKYGADSFDGLEWCQTTVDYKTGLLYHFQQRELFNDNCLYCSDTSLHYDLATFGHNLYFYRQWMEEIQRSKDDDNLQTMFKKYIPSKFMQSLEKLSED